MKQHKQFLLALGLLLVVVTTWGQNHAHRLVAESVAKTGNYDQLKALVDVICLFTIKTPDGKKYVSEQRFIFDGEKSWSRSLERHGTDEVMVQGFDGDSTWLLIDGKRVTDPEKLKNVRHARKTSFYLFAMNQKLLDTYVRCLAYNFSKTNSVNLVNKCRVALSP